MLTYYLFPHRCKALGWLLAGVGLGLWLLEQSALLKLPDLVSWLPSLVQDNSLEKRQNYDLYAVLFVVGAVLAACSREKQEDEYIRQVRLDALLWALYAYCLLLVGAIVLVSGVAFLDVMVYAMFAPLILFLLRFQLGLFLIKRSVTHD